MAEGEYVIVFLAITEGWGSSTASLLQDEAMRPNAMMGYKYSFIGI